MKHQAFSAKWSGNKPAKPPNAAYGLPGKAFGISAQSNGFHLCFHLSGLTHLYDAGLVLEPQIQGG